MMQKRSRSSIQSRIILFVAIIGLAMILAALFYVAASKEGDPSASSSLNDRVIPYHKT